MLHSLPIVICLFYGNEVSLFMFCFLHSDFGACYISNILINPCLVNEYLILKTSFGSLFWQIVVLLPWRILKNFCTKKKYQTHLLWAFYVISIFKQKMNRKTFLMACMLQRTLWKQCWVVMLIVLLPFLYSCVS